MGAVLEGTVQRIERHLRRRGLLGIDEDGADPDVLGDPEMNLAASAVSGQTPPAGPQWVRRLAPLEPHDLAYDKPLCASLDGFTLHAATRAGALHPGGREALLRYVLRPPIAQERLEPRPDGLVRITLKKAYTDGTVAVDMDPLSLLLTRGPVLVLPMRDANPDLLRALADGVRDEGIDAECGQDQRQRGEGSKQKHVNRRGETDRSTICCSVRKSLRARWGAIGASAARSVAASATTSRVRTSSCARPCRPVRWGPLRPGAGSPCVGGRLRDRRETLYCKSLDYVV